MRLTDTPDRGWWYGAKQGSFWILPQGNGRWRVWYQQENLGNYHAPHAALDDLVGNHCFSNSAGLDTSGLGLPRELSGWNRLLPDSHILFHPPAPGAV